MDLVYLDYNCFQRAFDDPRQVKIQMEALACQEVFIRAEEGKLSLVWSFMHEDETILCPFPERRLEVTRLATLCKVRVGPEEEIRRLAASLQQSGGFSAKDAVHPEENPQTFPLACGSRAKVDCLLTCDDLLTKRSKRLKLDLVVMNPVDYMRREVS